VTAAHDPQAALERTVMEWLLAGDHPVLDVLRAQYAAAEITRRAFHGGGVDVHFRVPETAPRLPSEVRIVIDDIGLRLEGCEHDAGAMVFVDDGVLSKLELVIWIDRWPGAPRLSAIHYFAGTLQPSGVILMYPSRERDMEALGRVLNPRRG
jgi:hypothetical protein